MSKSYLASHLGETELAALVSARSERAVRRLDRDLAVLARHLSPADLTRHYINPFRSGGVGAGPETFAVARAAALASAIVPHHPGPDGRNYDARIWFGRASVALEVKHQRDDFPFNAPTREVEPGVVLYEGSRPGADLRFLDLPSGDTTHSLPGSNAWRETVLEAAAQLPTELPSVVALSVDAFGGIEDDIRDALYGDVVIEGRPSPAGVGSTHRWVRVGNGALLQEAARHLAGVWAFRLRPDDTPSTDLGVDWARWYPNRRCDKGLPLGFQVAMVEVFGTTPDEE